MRVRRKTIVGLIDERGEIIAPWDAMREFCALHRGKRVIFRADIQPTEPSERTRNYFFGYCLPEIQAAYMTEYGEHLTREQTYDRIRGLCPLFSSEERVEGKWRTTIKEFEELDQAEANEAIEWLFQYCAENLSLILDDPR